MKKNRLIFLIFLSVVFNFILNTNFANAQCCVDVNNNCIVSNSCTLPYISSMGITCEQLHSTNSSTCANLFTASPISDSTTTSSTTTSSLINTNYALLEGIPGFFNAGELVDFPSYILAIYKFGLWTIGFCAMFMIMVGGYMYLTSAGNTASAGKAKEVITDAFIGLFLALFSYLILYIINPDLINITINF